MLASASTIKISLLACLSISACVSVAVKEPRHCEQGLEIHLTQEHPRLSAGERRERLMSLRLVTKVDCVSSEAIIPSSLSEAISWLSDMLPADALFPIVSASDRVAYDSSNYGYSLEDDLGDFISSAWRLTADSGICAELATAQALVAPDDCTFELIQSLR